MGQIGTALDFVTPGTALAGYPLVVDANKALDTLNVVSLSTGAGAGTAITSTAAELNQLHSVTPGTAAASKVVVLDANTAVTGLKMPLGAAATIQSLPVLTAASVFTPVTSGTVQNTEYPLTTFTLPANALSANGKALRIVAWGTVAANANAKTLKLYFGSQVIATVTGSTENGTPFYFEAYVSRISAGNQTCWARLTVTGAVVAETVTAGTQDETATILIKDASINTAAAAASATGLALIVQYMA